jgi:hypothetical protein
MCKRTQANIGTQFMRWQDNQVDDQHQTKEDRGTPF